MTQHYFITGTDTAVGKTRIAAGLMAAALKRGKSVLGLKPVSAGCVLRDGILTNDDAWELMQLSSTQRAYAEVNPVALKEAMAPHIAAEREERQLDVAQILADCLPSLESADFIVIEGAGGWLVPLNSTETMATLAEGLGMPVVLVVGMRLGCINHALLTSQAIQDSGLLLAGWVANCVEPDMPVLEDNIATLRERLPAPLVGVVPYLEESDAATTAKNLQIDLLQT